MRRCLFGLVSSSVGPYAVAPLVMALLGGGPLQAQSTSEREPSAVVWAEEASVFDDTPRAEGRVTPVRYQNTNAPPMPPRTAPTTPTPNRSTTPAPLPTTPSPAPNPTPQQPQSPPPNPNFNNQPSYNSLAGSPYMIGDTPAGDRIGFQLGEYRTQTQGPLNSTGPISNIRVVSPSIAAGRLNIAENESPLVRDRVIFNYRYFAQAAEVTVNDHNKGVHRLTDIHRFLVGFERRLSEDFSYQVRVPLNIQMGSNVLYTQLNQTPGSTTPGNLSGRSGELGNISLVFKKAMLQTNELYVSSGFGLNLPTGPDAQFTGIFNDLEYRRPSVNGVLAPTENANFVIQSTIRNQSVSVLPYLGGVWRPDEFQFSQAFLQFDLPLNPSEVALNAAGNLGGLPIFEANTAGKITPQSLLRLNLGTGFWLFRDDYSRLINSAGLMFESHFTTTMTNASILSSRGVSGAVPLTQIGNFANRLDVVNFVLAAPMIIGRTHVTNAFAAPITRGDNRGFNMEYSLLVNRVY